ncbi:MAG TPA: helix-turn-helix domain-containing protein, partial [Actinomycetota bacterium]|nr:helix-turn-helix domain-containing protein [Actinomycetota bacterium]
MSDPGHVFDALGDPTRRRLVAHLSSLGAASSTELSRVLPISRQAVSKHLDLLAEA